MSDEPKPVQVDDDGDEVEVVEGAAPAEDSSIPPDDDQPEVGGG